MPGENRLILVEVVVFVLVEVCLSNIMREGLKINIVRNTSDIVRLTCDQLETRAITAHFKLDGDKLQCSGGQ